MMHHFVQGSVCQTLHSFLWWVRITGTKVRHEEIHSIITMSNVIVLSSTNCNLVSVFIVAGVVMTTLVWLIVLWTSFWRSWTGWRHWVGSTSWPPPADPTSLIPPYSDPAGSIRRLNASSRTRWVREWLISHMYVVCPYNFCRIRYLSTRLIFSDSIFHILLSRRAKKYVKFYPYNIIFVSPAGG